MLTVGVHLQDPVVAAAHRRAVTRVQRGAVAHVEGVTQHPRACSAGLGRGAVWAAVVDDQYVDAWGVFLHGTDHVAYAPGLAVRRND